MEFLYTGAFQVIWKLIVVGVAIGGFVAIGKSAMKAFKFGSLKQLIADVVLGIVLLIVVLFFLATPLSELVPKLQGFGRQIISWIEEILRMIGISI